MNEHFEHIPPFSGPRTQKLYMKVNSRGCISRRFYTESICSCCGGPLAF